MAPKAAAPVGGPLPAVDDEVELPEGVDPVPEPRFAYAVVHVVSHAFALPPPEGETEPRTYDPALELLAKLKAEVPEDLTARRLVPVDREELEGLGAGEGPLEGLRRKLEAESGARRRKRLNAARTRAIAAAQGEAQEEAPPAADEDAADMLVVLADYPATAEELAELGEGGLFDAPDAWVTVHLDGETLKEEALAEGEEGEPRRHKAPCDKPEILGLLFDAIHAADPSSGLASATICSVADSQDFAPLTAADEEQVATSRGRVQDAVLRAAEPSAVHRIKFAAWIAAAREAAGSKVEIPARPEGKPDASLYHRLASTVDPASQDVPLLLHCLCEQVASTLSGDAHDKRAQAPDDELAQLEMWLGGHLGGLLPGELGDLGAEPHREDVDGRPPAPESEDDALVLPQLDALACRHAGGVLPGGVPVAGEVHRILSHVRSPGLGGSGFPEAPTFSDARRSALRNRFYEFIPGAPVAEIERLRLLHEFEQLLDRAQPERTWNLSERVFHEKIPAALLAQVLSDAQRKEYFVEHAYVDWYDCVLIAMHHRALPGRVLWHSWMGDVLTPTEAQEAIPALCMEPSFNDWWNAFASNQRSGAKMAPLPSRMLAMDAREMGYCKVVEKVLAPSDGSLLIRNSMQRGLRETFEHPNAFEGVTPPPPVNEDSDEEEGAKGGTLMPESMESFTKPLPPLHDLRSTHVMKGGVTFGICTDGVWSEEAARHRRAREELERAQREAEEAARLAAAQEAREKEEAAAARAAQGLEPVEEDDNEKTKKPPKKKRRDLDAEERALTERRLEDLQLGKFWLAFPDGARCAARVQLERHWYAEGAASWNTMDAKPGVSLTYTPPSGIVVQTYSDGAVRMAWPPRHFSRPELAPPLAEGQGPLPGDAGDLEVSRTVTALGVVIRALLSGRREVYHLDGTCATRNPTVEEIADRLDSYRGLAPPADGGSSMEVRYLERLAETWGALHGHPWLYERDEPPSDKEKAAGLPGHWRVALPDGKLVGRFAAPPPRPPTPPAPPAEGGLDAEGEAAAEGEGAAEMTATATGPAIAAAEKDPLQEVLDRFEPAVVVEDGAMIEYEIDPHSAMEVVDPHTGHRTTAHVEGLLMFADEKGLCQVSRLSDGTQITRRKTENGYDVVVERELVARVTCHVKNEDDLHPSTLTVAECEDGAQLEVVPRVLNAKSDLVPSNPKETPPGQELSTNASSLLRRTDGTMVSSQGSGEICIVIGSDVAQLGETEAVKNAADRAGAYVVRLDGDSIGMRDQDGNRFEVKGDQSLDLKLAVSMGDGFSSPRCKVPCQAYLHPDSRFLPLPEDVPPPRLFVVRRDGSAEELKVTADVQEALRLARRDKDAVVTEAEPMGPPMERCRCYTVFRNASMEPPRVSVQRPSLPSAIAGFEDVGALPAPARAFTEFRQFVEYPAISDPQRDAFLSALARFAAREEAHKAEHEAYGKGLELRPPKAHVEFTPASRLGTPGTPTPAPAGGGA